MKKYNKKGISLIVLVITIIVMIILAAAIILSISNSGIMDKANKAKTDSDIANLKEYVNVLEAEWELMTEDERKDTGKSTKTEYVNAKLEEKDYTQALLMKDGTLYTNLQANTKEALKNDIKIGDRVNYTVTSKTETSTIGVPNSDYSDWDSKPTVSNKTNFVWRYIGMSEKGELLIAPDMTTDSPTLKLFGSKTFSNGPAELDRICDSLYSSNKGIARSINIDDVNNLLGYIGEKGGYYDSANTDLVLTKEIKTISAIAKEINYDVNKLGTVSLDNKKKLEEYESDYYIINKEDINKMKHPDNIRYVYSGTSYWLASNAVALHKYCDIVGFYLRCVNSDRIAGELFAVIGSDSGTPIEKSYAIRPVVALNANITKSSDSNGIIWNF